MRGQSTKSLIELAGFFFFFKARKHPFFKKKAASTSLTAPCKLRFSHGDCFKTEISNSRLSGPRRLPGMHPPQYLPNSINTQSGSEKLLQAETLQKIVSPASAKHGFCGNTRCVTLRAVVGSSGLSSRDWLSMPATSAWRALFYIVTVGRIIKHPSIHSSIFDPGCHRAKPRSILDESEVDNKTNEMK